MKNQTVCFSHALELQLPLAKKLLSAAFAQGARATFKAEECSVYVCLEGEEGQRLKSARERGAKILSVVEFQKRLDLE